MLAAVKDGKVILGLSGNPGAAAVGFLHIGLPYMKKLCGRNDIHLTKAQAILAAPFEKLESKYGLNFSQCRHRTCGAFFLYAYGGGCIPEAGCSKNIFFHRTGVGECAVERISGAAGVDGIYFMAWEHECFSSVGHENTLAAHGNHYIFNPFAVEESTCF